MDEEKPSKEDIAADELIATLPGIKGAKDTVFLQIDTERFLKLSAEFNNFFDNYLFIEAFARLDAEIDRQLRFFFNELNNDPKFDEVYAEIYDQKLPGLNAANWLRKHKAINQNLFEQIHNFKKTRNKLAHDFENNYKEFRLWNELNKGETKGSDYFFDLVNEKLAELSQQQKIKVDKIEKKFEMPSETGILELTAEDVEFIEKTTRQLIEQKMESKLKELKTSLNKGLDCLQEIISQKHDQKKKSNMTQRPKYLPQLAKQPSAQASQKASENRIVTKPDTQ